MSPVTSEAGKRGAFSSLHLELYSGSTGLERPPHQRSMCSRGRHSDANLAQKCPH